VAFHASVASPPKFTLISVRPETPMALEASVERAPAPLYQA